jgi:hypothetical protein
MTAVDACAWLGLLFLPLFASAGPAPRSMPLDPPPEIRRRPT